MSSSTRDTAAGRRRGSALFWLVPALTFLVGLLVGGIVVGLTGVGDDLTAGGDPGEQRADEPDDAAAAPTPSPGETGDRTVTVPAECIEVAERSQEALGLTQEAARALGELDPRRVQEIVDQLQDLDPQVRRLAASCRDAGVEDVLERTEEPTPTTG